MELAPDTAGGGSFEVVGMERNGDSTATGLVGGHDGEVGGIAKLPQ